MVASAAGQAADPDDQAMVGLAGRAGRRLPAGQGPCAPVRRRRLLLDGGVGGDRSDARPPAHTFHRYLILRPRAAPPDWQVTVHTARGVVLRISGLVFPARRAAIAATLQAGLEDDQELATQTAG